MTTILKKDSMAAMERVHAVALARSELPLFFGLMGLLLVLWAGVLFAFGCRACASQQAMQNLTAMPTYVVCENQENRSPGALLRCTVPPATDLSSKDI